MKKLFKYVSAVIVSTAFVGSLASAATCDASIGQTGPGSNNQIKCNLVNNVKLKCNNDVYLMTVNNQDAQSGDGEIKFNTSAGGASTGDAINDNATVTNVQIDNLCAAALSAVGPVGGGGGAIVPPPATPPAAAPAEVPAVLPFTASASLVPLAIASLAGSALVVVTSRLAVAAYRRVTLK